jgi:hypothetical protein
MTDKEGKYSVKIWWSVICPSGIGHFERRKFTKKANPKYIIFEFNGNQQKVRNKWQKYGAKYTWKKEKDIIYVKNLYF